jgi:hypothetical protein
MFTVIAFVLLILLAWLVQRKNEKDRSTYDGTPSDLREWLLLLHLRQDMKLVAFLLGGILIMLGVVADRIR